MSEQPHTCMHNSSLQPFAQDYDLASHTTNAMCVNFVHEWGNLQFKVDSERHVFEKIFMAILFTLRIFARNLLRGSWQRIFIFFRFDVWPGIWTRALHESNKLTHCLLDFGPSMLYWTPNCQLSNFEKYNNGGAYISSLVSSSETFDLYRISSAFSFLSELLQKFLL